MRVYIYFSLCEDILLFPFLIACDKGFSYCLVLWLWGKKQGGDKLGQPCIC